MTENLRVWSALAKTDPNHTKTFKRAGGFSGTAVKPIYQTQKITEQFGPCGIGWGIGEPQFTIVNGDNKEVLVFCTVAVWHTAPENRFYGVGGDKVVTYIKANPQYSRPERWENDDEAFKKAFTDAVGNAFKQLGMAADVHMGLFDDAKYVAGLRREAEDAKQAHVSDDTERVEKTTQETRTKLYPARIPVAEWSNDIEKDAAWKAWANLFKQAIDDAQNIDELNRWMRENDETLENLSKHSMSAEQFLTDRAAKRRHLLSQAPAERPAA